MQAGLRPGHEALHGFAAIVSTHTSDWAVGLQGQCMAHRVRALIDDPRCRVPSYRPSKRGARFSTKATAAALWSAVSKVRIM